MLDTLFDGVINDLSIYPDPTNEVSTLVELFRWRGVHQAERRALTFLQDGESEESHLSYGDLDQEARCIAARLQSLGACGGERVILLFPSGAEFITSFLGCLYAGAVAVPVAPPRINRNLSRLHGIITNAQPKLALTSAAIFNRLSPMLEEAGLNGIRWMSSEGLAAEGSSDWQEPAVDGDTLAFLQYTSGSTALPKGVMTSHKNLLSNHRMLRSAFGQTEESTIVTWLPLFHDMGLAGSVLQALSLGAHCVVIPPEAFLMKPVRWLQAISRYRAHTSGGPNFAYELCARRITREQRSSLNLSSWEVAFCGAEPVRATTMERFAETFSSCGLRREALFPCYGLAEATVFVSGVGKLAGFRSIRFKSASLEQHEAVVTGEKERDRVLVGCGKGWLDQKILIVDPVTATPCSEGKVGEIWLSGPNVAQGYWNRPDETGITFNACLAGAGEKRYLRTGDLGFFHGDSLFIPGRLKDLIVVAGRKHHPGDIEHTVEECNPAIRRGCCAAFAIEKEHEERLVVVAELERTFREPDTRGVERAIRSAVAEAHDLATYAMLFLKPASCPRTSSGKIMRHACRTGFLSGTLDIWEGSGCKPTR